MMKNVQETYSGFHKAKQSNHLYPTEWVIRTLLGNYPDLKLDKTNYKGSKILDLGFGDCRNMELLFNCGFQIYGIEITNETVDLGYKTLERKGINAILKTGNNTNIPFENNYFDFILASSSCYYVDDGGTFEQNLNEIYRCLKPGGQFVANFPAFAPNPIIEESFILKNCDFTNDGHILIQNDIYGLRNGYKFKAFKNRDELSATLKNKFDNISIGTTIDNYYGVQINTFILTCRKIS